MRKVKFDIYNGEYSFDAKEANEYEFDNILVDKITSKFIKEAYNSSNYVVDYKKQEIAMYDVGLSKYYHNLMKYKYSK